MVELEYKSYGLVAKARQFLKAQTGDFSSLDDDRSLIRPIDASQDVQQGALAGSRNPGDGHHLAFRQAETQVHQHLEAFVTGLETLEQAADLQKITHNEGPPPDPVRDALRAGYRVAMKLIRRAVKQISTTSQIFTWKGTYEML